MLCAKHGVVLCVESSRNHMALAGEMWDMHQALVTAILWLQAATAYRLAERSTNELYVDTQIDVATGTKANSSAQQTGGSGGYDRSCST